MGELLGVLKGAGRMCVCEDVVVDWEGVCCWDGVVGSAVLVGAEGVVV